MQYKITNRQNQTAIIEAHRFERDGSGTRFYDASGEQIASFGDGEIRSVIPADLAFEGGDNE